MEGQLRPVLVTGFEPYGNRKTNPAYDTMRALSGRNIAGAEIIGRSLPVAIASLKANVDAILEEITPSAIISIGLWPGEPLIRLERVGINIADFEIPDNEGTLWQDREISGNGAAARLASLPLRKIQTALLAAGIPVRLSSTAGTFLCNACLYSFPKRWNKKPCPYPAVLSTYPIHPKPLPTWLQTSGRAAGLNSTKGRTWPLWN
jgi:pyroglutamyl-peptidase